MGQHTQIYSERNLLRKVKKGSLKGFETLFFIYEYKVLSFIAGYTKSVHVAEDLTQEVFIKIWANRKKIDLDKNFRAYLFTIAKYLVLNYLRDHMKRTPFMDDLEVRPPSVAEDIESRLIYEEYKDIVDDIVNSFPKKRRSIYIMSRQEGKSNEEIARILGISKKTVKNNLWEALLILKKQLKPHMECNIKVISFLVLSRETILFFLF